MKRSITTAKPNRNGIIKIWEKKDVGILLSLQDISYRSANMIVNSAQFRPGPQLSTPRPNRGRIHGHSSTSPSEYPGSLLLQASREQAGHAKDRAGKQAGRDPSSNAKTLTITIYVKLTCVPRAQRNLFYQIKALNRMEAQWSKRQAMR